MFVCLAYDLKARFLGISDYKGLVMRDRQKEKRFERNNNIVLHSRTGKLELQQSCKARLQKRREHGQSWKRSNSQKRKDDNHVGDSVVNRIVPMKRLRKENSAWMPIKSAINRTPLEIQEKKRAEKQTPQKRPERNSALKRIGSIESGPAGNIFLAQQSTIATPFCVKLR